MIKTVEKIDTCVYVNGSASPKVRGIAKAIVGSRVVHIHRREDLKGIPDYPSRIITAGGEGTNLAVTQWMFDKKFVCPVGLLGGGTQNILYNEMLGKDVMTIDQFRQTKVDEFPKEYFFHPGQVGDNVVFNNQFGIGIYETMMGRLNENLRFIPRKFRPLRAALARITPLLLAVYGEPKMELFSVVQKVGKIPLFPGQDAFTEDLTHVSVNTWFDLITSLRLGRRLRKDPKLCLPQNVIKREQKESFEVNITGNSVWIDGDTIGGSQIQQPPYNTLRGSQTVRRSDFAFPIVALKQ